MLREIELKMSRPRTNFYSRVRSPGSTNDIVYEIHTQLNLEESIFEVLDENSGTSFYYISNTTFQPITSREMFSKIINNFGKEENYDWATEGF